MSEHERQPDVYVKPRYPVDEPPTYRALCSCGWTGPERYRGITDTDWQEHKDDPTVHGLDYIKARYSEPVEDWEYDRGGVIPSPDEQTHDLLHQIRSIVNEYRNGEHWSSVGMERIAALLDGDAS
jgi:hypothetical protein